MRRLWDVEHIFMHHSAIMACSGIFLQHLSRTLRYPRRQTGCFKQAVDLDIPWRLEQLPLVMGLNGSNPFLLSEWRAWRWPEGMHALKSGSQRAYQSRASHSEKVFSQVIVPNRLLANLVQVVCTSLQRHRLTVSSAI
jgi:hypothetical protein